MALAYQAGRHIETRLQCAPFGSAKKISHEREFADRLSGNVLHVPVHYKISPKYEDGGSRRNRPRAGRRWRIAAMDHRQLLVSLFRRSLASGNPGPQRLIARPAFAEAAGEIIWPSTGVVDKVGDPRTPTSDCENRTPLAYRVEMDAAGCGS